MDDTNLKQLLKQADASAELPPLDAVRLASTARRRLRRQKQLARYGTLAAAAMIAVVCVFSMQKYQSYRKEQRIAQLQQKVEELTRRTEQTLAVVEKMLKRQEQQSTQHRLASYQDPIQQQVDEAALILVYQADRMAEKYNNKETAIDYYSHVIDRFGNTPSAQTAGKQLIQIEQKNQPNQI